MKLKLATPMGRDRPAEEKEVMYFIQKKPELLFDSGFLLRLIRRCAKYQSAVFTGTRGATQVAGHR